MSEILPTDPVEMLNEIGLYDDKGIYERLQSHYGFLNSYDYYPGAVEERQEVFPTDSGAVHEYMFQVGYPMKASDVFQSGIRSVEVAGPSDYSKLKTVSGSFRPTIVTNIEPIEGVDHVADARSLPYPSSSFSAVLAMNPPGLTRGANGDPRFAGLRLGLVQESYRILEPGGYFLLRGGVREDLDEMRKAGFQIEAGSGCIRGWLKTREVATSKGVKFTEPTFIMEILLHK